MSADSASESHLLQAIMDTGRVEDFAGTTTDGKLHPILFMTNGLLPAQDSPSYQSVSIVVSDSEDVSIDGYTIIEITRYRRLKNKVDIRMQCRNNKIRMKFKDQEDAWVLKSFKIRGKGKFIIDKEF